MIAVAQNPYYEFSYDPAKNRLYFKFLGYWKSPDVVPDYLQEWGHVIKLTKPGFTIVADVRNMITHPREVKQLHEKAIDLCIIAGVSHIAEVTPADKIAVLQTTGMADKAQLSYNRFPDVASADAYLDQLYSYTF
ncbi:hypothetical protein [Adhaeribacter aquaticus]|uniref:hypothetical protein n=1 Tax=Adhaeribacter aquaticus TaxID=299567 RepID=UPI0004215040|nr:hypothetical protein [Adhaeribacter aquaticus]